MYVIVLGALAVLVAAMLIVDLRRGQARRRRRDQRSLQIVFRVPGATAGSDATIATRGGSREG